ncbi:MAG TPA: hypothetical protein VNY07_09275 [Chthoniobacterales bacterium]|nr:hypothetical protein [Chthoniobacterales bacterium]
MKVNCRAIFIVLIFALQSVHAAPPARSVSPSQQFIIYGADAASRGAVSELAERTKANFLALLRRPDRWKTPVIINLQLPQANLPKIPAAGLRFSQTGFGLKLQLDLTIARDVDGSLVERALLQAILLEMIYRNQPDIAAGTRYVQPPDWLLDGALALTPGRDRGPLVEALLLPDKIIPLEELLRGGRISELDSPARLLYRAYSFALVQLLVDATGGPEQLVRYIDNLSRSSTDPLADLRAQFPTLDGGAEKTWRSSVARLRATQSYQLLTFAETERRLGELLCVRISDPGRPTRMVQLDDLSQRKILPVEIAAIAALSQELLLLAARANPILRPIVQEYQQIASLLVKGKRKGLTARLAQLQANRAKLTTRMTEIDDYMNWFEATQSKTKSGAFADYLKAVQGRNEARPRRRDALSVYLDAMEEQFQN